MIFLEKLAEPTVKAVKPPAAASANRWEGEDEDEVKVSIAC